MSAKRQLTLHLDAEVASAIEAEGKRRGLTLSRAANDAVRRVLLDETGEGLAASIRARLDRLDKRDYARARELALIKETLLLFVRVWLEYAGPLDDSDPDAGADAEIRFQGFLEMLAEHTD
ncbi:MAG: hypothetical protein BroJett013_12160 [Alphaproteobacteria bacterium]|nr:MAG: hypothetical protein BroJett013_12160 [Alphaproteobacteria bacterium]